MTDITDARLRVIAFLDGFDNTSGGYGEEDVIVNGEADLLASDLRILLASGTDQ